MRSWMKRDIDMDQLTYEIDALGDIMLFSASESW